MSQSLALATDGYVYIPQSSEGDTVVVDSLVVTLDEVDFLNVIVEDR